MTKFMNDFFGAIFDNFKLICYFFAGVLIVGVPLFLIAKFFELFH